MPVLRVLEGAAKGQAFAIAGERVTIGRDPENPVCLPDAKASRMHCEIVHREGRWLLRDLGSSNGTWSEHGRIDSLELADGARFRIGRTWLRFELEPAPAAGRATVLGLERTETSALLRVGGERASAYLALLHHIVVQSHGARGRDELFAILDDAAAEVLEGDRVAVFLPDAEGWSLWPPHEQRLRARWGSVPFAQTLLAEVRQRREPLLVALPPGPGAGPDADLPPSASMVQAGVVTAMAAPLRIGDEVHALLYVDRLRSARPFTRLDLEFLAAVANQLAVMLANGERVARLSAEVERLRAQPRAAGEPELLGRDPAIEAVRAFIARAAPTDAPVLILGESGTGKELVARAVHARSRRAARPLQVINCAAIAEGLIESALFGHVKGAFTGADETRPGVFELADRATLFLDEIGELPLPAQAKLLRALEQGEVQRVGEATARRVDVRLIAATNRDLAAEARAGRFREDLLHRLDVLSVTLPPLRERPGDLELLIEHFLADSARRLGRPAKRLAPEARTALLRHHWPGNVRQLRNAIERATIMAEGPLIGPEHLPPELRGRPPTVAIATPLATLAEVERAHILRVLEHCGGNKKLAAEILGIDRSTLYAKLRQYGQQA